MLYSTESYFLIATSEVPTYPVIKHLKFYCDKNSIFFFEDLVGQLKMIWSDENLFRTIISTVALG